MGNSSSTASRSDIPERYKQEIDAWMIDSVDVASFEALYDNKVALGNYKEKSAEFCRKKREEDLDMKRFIEESMERLNEPCSTLAMVKGRKIRDRSKKILVYLSYMPAILAEKILPRIEEFYAKHGWEVHFFDGLHGFYPSDVDSTDPFLLKNDMRKRPMTYAFKDALEFCVHEPVDCILVSNSAWSMYCNEVNADPEFTDTAPSEERVYENMPVFREMITKAMVQPVARVIAPNANMDKSITLHMVVAAFKSTRKQRALAQIGC